MIPPYSFLRQFAGEQAHLECQNQTLFSRHGALNLKLESLCRRACIGSRHHGQMLPRNCTCKLARFTSAQTFPAAWLKHPAQFLPRPPLAFAPIAAGRPRGVGLGPPALVSPEIVRLRAWGRGA